ncbi:hypothetical protein FOL47_008712 [Perkinsus chesapeaki]|uniref:Uncharacterized protein n=1 Tax=Perkinsus chesapeaki TaxID=330153 RepID=A0A7J6LCA0_PERCH|nr:hypothetical protein FOL47_008712 [Perkinsus chesapeaki]
MPVKEGHTRVVCDICGKEYWKVQCPICGEFFVALHRHINREVCKRNAQKKKAQEARKSEPITPFGEHITPLEELIQTSEEPNEPSKELITPFGKAARDAVALQVDVSSTTASAPVITTPPGESITPPGEGTTPPEESITSPEESITPSGESITPPGEGTTRPEESITPPGESITPPGESITPPGEGTTPPEESITPPGDITPPGESITPLEDPIESLEEPIETTTVAIPTSSSSAPRLDRLVSSIPRATPVGGATITSFGAPSGGPDVDSIVIPIYPRTLLSVHGTFDGWRIGGGAGPIKGVDGTLVCIATEPYVLMAKANQFDNLRFCDGLYNYGMTAVWNDNFGTSVVLGTISVSTRVLVQVLDDIYPPDEYLLLCRYGQKLKIMRELINYYDSLVRVDHRTLSNESSLVKTIYDIGRNFDDTAICLLTTTNPNVKPWNLLSVLGGANSGSLRWSEKVYIPGAVSCETNVVLYPRLVHFLKGVMGTKKYVPLKYQAFRKLVNDTKKLLRKMREAPERWLYGYRLEYSLSIEAKEGVKLSTAYNAVGPRLSLHYHPDVAVCRVDPKEYMSYIQLMLDVADQSGVYSGPNAEPLSKRAKAFAAFMINTLGNTSPHIQSLEREGKFVYYEYLKSFAMTRGKLHNPDPDHLQPDRDECVDMRNNVKWRKPLTKADTPLSVAYSIKRFGPVGKTKCSKSHPSFFSAMREIWDAFSEHWRDRVVLTNGRNDTPESDPFKDIPGGYPEAYGTISRHFQHPSRKRARSKHAFCGRVERGCKFKETTAAKEGKSTAPASAAITAAVNIAAADARRDDEVEDEVEDKGEDEVEEDFGIWICWNGYSARCRACDTPSSVKAAVENE